MFTPVLHKCCQPTGECISKKIRSHDQRRKKTGQGSISQFKTTFYIRRDFIIRINCKNSSKLTRGTLVRTLHIRIKCNRFSSFVNPFMAISRKGRMKKKKVQMFSSFIFFLISMYLSKPVSRALSTLKANTAFIVNRLFSMTNKKKKNKLYFFVYI